MKSTIFWDINVKKCIFFLKREALLLLRWDYNSLTKWSMEHKMCKALITSDGMNPSTASPAVAAASSMGWGICSSTLTAASSGVGSCGSLNY
jgi:hypothetical protein